jgi:hypothetical protein
MRENSLESGSATPSAAQATPTTRRPPRRSPCSSQPQSAAKIGIV